MSDCMTVADIFTAGEKYADEGLAAAKDIVQSILSDALHSVVVNSDKVSDSNRIGDCNVGQEFMPLTGSPPVNRTESAAEEIGESQGEKKWEGEEKSKDYRVIEEQALADSELRIENGKIHLHSNGTKGPILVNLSNFAEISQAKEVNKSQSCGYGDNEKKLDSSSGNVLVVKSGQEKPEESSIREEQKQQEEKESVDEGGKDSLPDCERPFTPFTTEDIRKSILEVWKNVNSPLLNGWKGEIVNQPQEVVRLMEELATIQVTPKGICDPNKAKSHKSIEEEVKKVMREMEKVNFNSNAPSGEEANVTRSEGTMKAEEEGEEGEETEVVDMVSPGSVVQFQSEKFNQSSHFDTSGEILAVSLTDSDEAFIESSERVIQVIEPRDETIEDSDDGKVITFSLLNELDNDGELLMDDYENGEEDVDGWTSLNVGGRFDFASDFTLGFRQEEDEKLPRFRSGMTTVGPIKDQRYDPKLLSGPEVDYGRVTRIDGSRELTDRESLTSPSSRKVAPDEIEDNPMIFFENGYLEIETIANHEIASLTKMQKVREVLSDQPKSDEDFRGDEKIVRSPLDLKDVDADSCNSYSVIDIGIPLMTVEETNRDKTGRDFCPTPPNGTNYRNAEASNSKVGAEKEMIDDSSTTSSSLGCRKSSTQVNIDQGQKHNTISRVFQKASSRFIGKESDSFLRNSKSLPRDTSKMTNTESFRSLLDDCQTSAATFLKKSRSLLRNTQNVFKVVSRTGFGHAVPVEKQVDPIEKTESRQSTSSKKSELLKLKDSIKNKVGKTLKSFENVKASSESANQIDNQKKLSKSHLLCPNQQPHLKDSSVNRKIESDGSKTMPSNECEGFDCHEGNQNFHANDGMENVEKEIEVICGVKFQGRRRSPGAQDEGNDASSSETADYAVVESVSDGSAAPVQEENSERPNSAAGGLTESGKGADAKKSLTLPVDGALDVRIGRKSLNKSLSNGKLSRKNKKLSASFRSFWQTAFGKVKATTQKKDVS